MKKYTTPKNFEDAMLRLEVLTQAMQQPETPLEEALSNYEEGRKLIAFCREKLTQAEQRLQILDQGELKDFTLQEQDE
ncbi:MAG: exodeoxyribonuclease VII small subunit [Neisseriaceae bacterium]|nr:exodeoxyribonuclease VII small subunit [Neisseriaceae bacterium]